MEEQNIEKPDLEKQDPAKPDPVKPTTEVKILAAIIIIGVFVYICVAIYTSFSKDETHSYYESVLSSSSSSSDYSVTPKSTVTGEQAYIIACDLIKDQVSTVYPDNDFPLLDYKYDDIKFETYIIVSYFTYKVDGVERKYNYKAKVQFNGGEWSNKNNWTLHYTERYNN